ncbi:replicative DNA helicase (plasmid) [Lysinibacillus capsici]|uniref:replicative DNA helicase n=1 Tax=Lysinibacillus capsici TaxID=2115968 RepID=UPI0021DA3AFA|nr:replicative DNA helicase [Lysinibacillus capsici]UYB50131.1 replicative DNA helicase [Lysinibacillus capsici]UYB50204.1 replicative DNA helicase [Lysinibacillus capsici]
MNQDISMELVEKSILATMLKENYLITDSLIGETHFTTLVHRNIFNSMRQLASQGKSCDYITLLTTREPEELGGANYLKDLTNYHNPKMFDQYVEALIDNWREGEKRNILFTAQAENWSVAEIQKVLTEIEDVNSDSEIPFIKYLASIGELPYEVPIEPNGIYTGINDFDMMTDGLQDGELTIIAARPSMGKTDTFNHIAINVGLSGYFPIIFSLEMPKKALTKRLIAALGNFNRNAIRNPYKYFSEAQKEKWLPTVTELSHTNIEIDDRPGITTAQIRAKARKWIKEKPHLKPVILIDYLQIIKGEEKAGRNQTQITGQISADLKNIAREFNCPVVCLSQLSRDVEKRNDKRPMMSDLRDSGSIEQDADVIAFLYRDEYYNKESENKDMMEIIIAKQRNGQTGPISVIYKKETGKLLNIAWDNQRSTTTR